MATYRLFRKDGQLHVQEAGKDESVAVRAVWALPVTGRGGPVVLLDAKKKEVALLDDLATLDAASRQLVEEELRCRYLLPRITRVIRTTAQLGTRYWHVETDHGPRHFVVRNPNRDVVWISDDQLVLRDPLGNRFEIPSLAALDSLSRAEVLKVV
jgi:hypothetical protein